MLGNIASNSSNASVYDYFIYGNKVPFTVVFSLQFFFAITGNLLIVWIVCKDNRLKTTTNYLVANMAASDLFGALVVFPGRIDRLHFDGRWLFDGDFGNVLCKLCSFTGEVSFAVSVYSCVFIAIDRYYAVAHPLVKKPFQRKIRYIIAGIWILSALLKSLIWHFQRIYEYEDQTRCGIPQDIYPQFLTYYYTMGAFNVGLPAAIITIIYALIVYKLYKHKLPGRQTDSAINRRDKQQRKVLKLSVTIVVLLYLSWGFFAIFFILKSQGMLNHLSMSEQMDIQYASYVMLYMSHVYNFFIYLIFNNVYRESIKTMIAKCCFTQLVSNQSVHRRDAISASTGLETIEMHEIAK